MRMFYACTRRRSRAASVRLLGLALLFLPALSLAQTSIPVYTITTFAGTPPTSGKTGDTGAATAATLFGPASTALDSKGSLFIADQINDVIRVVTSGNINEFAGTGGQGYTGDGKAALNGEINIPDSIVVDSAGNVYISDVNNSVVRMVNPSLNISTFAGSQSEGAGDSGDGALAINAQMKKPSGLALDSKGNLYIADPGSFKIRLVSSGNISTIAGNGFQGYAGDGSPATLAKLGYPRQLAVDANGALYIADETNHEIRKITGGVITRVAGIATDPGGYSGDGGLATNAHLNHPSGVAVDAAGDVFIADTYNHVIRIVTPDGIINTIAGNGKQGFSGDGGAALGAQFNFPQSITLDAKTGKIYVADYDNNAIRLLTPSTGPGGQGATPAIRTANGVISASGFGALSTVSPGTWVEIYGSNLAATTRSWAPSDFTGILAPTSLNRTSVTIDGKSAFVDYVSPTQVNAQIPDTVGLGPKPVTVSTASGSSAAFTVNVSLQQPALYAPAAFLNLGKQYVGALFTDFKTFVFPTGTFPGVTSRPAKPGDTIVFYGIGFGPVPGNPAGQIAQAANGLTLPITPKFYFGGTQAQVSYAALVGGSVGLYQFNVVVPPIANNDSVPLTFTVNIGGTDVPGAQTLYTAVHN